MPTTSHDAALPDHDLDVEPPLSGPKPPAGVLERGISILECFSAERLRLSLRELAERTGLDKATLLRLLTVLMRARMVLRLDSGQYVPGPALLHFGMLYRRTFDLGERLQPVLRELMQRTGETVAFYVLSGEERVCLYRENTVKEVRHHVEPGTRVPLAAGGASAHILKYFNGTSTPRAEQITHDGYVITRAERVPEMASIAVPVFENEGDFLGSLVIMGLASRQTVEAQVAGAGQARMLLAEHGFQTVPPSGWQAPVGS
ncbi:IclR family transcriptional regulator [Ottowia caeni]|uniref:IclR family transcriptional regulator n=1 Tax=Ottowia caeni TaxID=2870339 RepID=UPI001E474E47